MSYALEALVPSQFADRSTPSTVGHTIQVPNQAPSDALGYVENLYGAKFTDRWAAVGYLAVFIAGLQAMHLYEVRFRMHIDR